MSLAVAGTIGSKPVVGVSVAEIPVGSLLTPVCSSILLVIITQLKIIKHRITIRVILVTIKHFLIYPSLLSSADYCFYMQKTIASASFLTQILVGNYPRRRCRRGIILLVNQALPPPQPESVITSCIVSSTTLISGTSKVFFSTSASPFQLLILLYYLPKKVFAA